MVERFDHVLPDHIRRGALASFPGESWEWWHRYQNGKLATVDPSRIPRGCMAALDALAAAVPVEGFWDLDLYGAGLHMMPIGVALGTHRDASHHPQKPWRRLYSLVYFLEDCIGGTLTIDGQRIVPKPNTAVMFPANLLHSVDQAQTCRRTLSLFSWAVDTGEKLTTAAEFV